MRRKFIIPGRSLLIQNFESISRHKSEVREIQQKEIILSNGEQIETDILLWATGYRMNLQYLGLSEFDDINTLQELKPKLGSLVRSKEYPKLFFVGMSLIESTSSKPLFAAIESKSIVSHILGKCEIPLENSPHQINHWNLFSYYAKFDHANYPRIWWRIKYFILAWWYKIFPNETIKV